MACAKSCFSKFTNERIVLALSILGAVASIALIFTMIFRKPHVSYRRELDSWPFYSAQLIVSCLGIVASLVKMKRVRIPYTIVLMAFQFLGSFAFWRVCHLREVTANTCIVERTDCTETLREMTMGFATTLCMPVIQTFIVHPMISLTMKTRGFKSITIDDISALLWHFRKKQVRFK